MWLFIPALLLACFSTPSAPERPGDATKTEQRKGKRKAGPKRPPGWEGPEPPEELRCTERLDHGSQCFVHVPAGTLLMGAQATDPQAPGYDPDAGPDESPVHEVRLSDFWILRDEVNVATFQMCVGSGWCEESDVASGGYSTYDPEAESPSMQVLTSITWPGARTLCDFMNSRLPTEAQWEYAARGQDGRRWPWGDDPGCGVATEGGYAPDGSRKPRAMRTAPCDNEGPVAERDLMGRSPFGLTGMAGNVWEWTADAYAADAYAHHASQDPTGPAEGTARVQRGGGWTGLDPVELRSAARMSMDPSHKVHDVGLRCVWGAPDAP